MRPNKLRGMLQQGLPGFGTMIQEIRTPAIALILANAGYDFVFIDMEHSTFSIETASDLIKTIRLTGMTCLVRVSDCEYHLIARMLDAGAEGIMVPRVETREQVEYILRSAKYPPVGRRGVSVAKGHNEYQSADPIAFTAHANRENLIILQIESQQAVDDIDNLLSVPGVDVALIGPQDMSRSLGVPLDFGEPALKNAVSTVVAAAARHGIYSGLHISNMQALIDWHQQGMRVLTYSYDIEFLSRGASQGLADLRRGVGMPLEV